MPRLKGRRKHRVVVDVTFEDIITAKEAVSRVAAIMENHSWRYHLETYVCKQGTLAFAAYYRRRIKKQLDHGRSYGSDLIVVRPISRKGEP